MMDKTDVYVVSVNYRDYGFYNETDAINAFKALTKGFELETSWKANVSYMDNTLKPSLKVREVISKPDVMIAEEQYDRANQKVE